MPKISQQHIKGWLVAVPPLSEQQELAEFLDAVCVSLNNAIAAAEREIHLIREYRTRLIADVVTGQLDVRDLNLPNIEEAIIDEPEEIDAQKTDEDLAEDDLA
jgi:type I restriction enzyme, S subunit